MQPTARVTPASPIPVPTIDSDEPVAVIPAASVAPLDGPPDGERINTFVIATRDDGGHEDSAAHPLGTVRQGVLRRPLTCLAAAFSLGFVLARLLR